MEVGITIFVSSISAVSEVEMVSFACLFDYTHDQLCNSFYLHRPQCKILVVFIFGARKEDAAVLKWSGEWRLIDEIESLIWPDWDRSSCLVGLGKTLPSCDENLILLKFFLHAVYVLSGRFFIDRMLAQRCYAFEDGHSWY